MSCYSLVIISIFTFYIFQYEPKAIILGSVLLGILFSLGLYFYQINGAVDICYYQNRALKRSKQEFRDKLSHVLSKIEAMNKSEHKGVPEIISLLNLTSELLNTDEDERSYVFVSFNDISYLEFMTGEVSSRGKFIEISEDETHYISYNEFNDIKKVELLQLQACRPTEILIRDEIKKQKFGIIKAEST